MPRGRLGLPWRLGPHTDDALAAAGPAPGPHHRAAVRTRETAADPAAVFLWLCQLRRAPYSYDWLDNFGRRSPRRADPSLTDLRVGQRVMTIFTLVAHDPGRGFDLRMNPGAPTAVFGDITVRYRVRPLPGGGTRLEAVLWMPPHPFLGRPVRWLLGWGDALMMHRQLRTLTDLALAEGPPPA